MPQPEKARFYLSGGRSSDLSSLDLKAFSPENSGNGTSYVEEDQVAIKTMTADNLQRLDRPGIEPEFPVREPKMELIGSPPH